MALKHKVLGLVKGGPVSDLCACKNTDYHHFSPLDWEKASEDGDVSLACISTNSELDSPPWVRDGVLNCAFVSSKVATPYYDEAYDLFNIEQAAASYYLLDVIIYDLATEFDTAHRLRHNADPYVVSGLFDEGARPRRNDELNELSIQAQLHKHKIVMEMAAILRNYMHRAVVGEMCHHELVRLSFFPKTKYALFGWQELIRRVGGPKAVSYAVELFEDKSRQVGPVWNSAFGGKRWADIARVLQWYEQGFIHDTVRGRSDLQWWEAGWKRPEFSEYEFIDRVLTLQHNTGTALDKVGWYGGLGCMHKILDAHHSGNLSILRKYSDVETIDFLATYWRLKNRQCGTDIPMPKNRTCPECGYNIRPDQRVCEDCERYFCKVDGCDFRSYDNSLCSGHYDFVVANPDVYVWRKTKNLPKIYSSYCQDLNCDCAMPKLKEHWREDERGNATSVYEYQVLDLGKLKEFSYGAY